MSEKMCVWRLMSAVIKNISSSFFFLQFLFEFPVLWFQGHVHIFGLLYSSSAEYRHHCGKLLPLSSFLSHLITCQKHSSPTYVNVCCTSTDGVGVQDLFNHDWAEDTSAQAEGVQREEREEWLIPLLMSKNGLQLGGIANRRLCYANPKFWIRKTDFFLLL